MAQSRMSADTTPSKKQRLVIVGSRQMANSDHVDKQFVLYDQHVDIKGGEPISVNGSGQSVEYPPDEPLRCECQALLPAVATQLTPLTDGHSGLRVLAGLQAAQRSLVMHGEPVSLPIEVWS